MLYHIAMTIDYVNKKLEKSLSDNRIIKREYGRLAYRIIEVLDELYVADNLAQIPEVPPDRRHKMTNVDYTWSIDLSRNYRMWVRSDGEDDPKAVTKVTVVSILDDH